MQCTREKGRLLCLDVREIELVVEIEMRGAIWDGHLAQEQSLTCRVVALLRCRGLGFNSVAHGTHDERAKGGTLKGDLGSRADHHDATNHGSRHLCGTPHLSALGNSALKLLSQVPGSAAEKRVPTLQGMCLNNSAMLPCYLLIILDTTRVFLV